MRWKKVTLIGVGLLGGSLGLALKKARLADCVVGLVRRRASISQCLKHGAVDVATCDLALAVKGADLVVLCTPISQMRPLVEQMLPFLQRAAIVTDVGSVKGSVVRELEPLIAGAGAWFIGSHPMAGAETNGVAAARGDLFVKAVCVVTPGRRTNPRALRRVKALWRSVGSRLLELSPRAHDKLVSRSSHLTHVVAVQLARWVLNADSSQAQAAVCASGFRDTTRVASGSPEMWRDIALANREQLLRSLDGYARELARFRTALRKKDGAGLGRLFEQGKEKRDRWSRQMQVLSSE